MPVGKKADILRREEQGETLGVPSEGFSIPNSDVERLNSRLVTGYLSPSNHLMM